MFERMIEVLAESSGRMAFDPDEPVDGTELLQQITQFIGRYLQCSGQQRAVMALWVLHTYCLSAAQVTPYLAIQSAHKQSGKSLCLQLLSLLCDHPAFSAGFTASTLARRMNERIVSAVLLDEFQATLGTRARSKSPALRALLASGYQCGPGYSSATEERKVFCPKAFAGMGQLPEALADRSIPIILEPLEARVAQAPSPVSGSQPPAAALPQATPAAHHKIQRFHLRRAILDADPLKRQLYAWAKQNLPDLKEMAPYSQQDFPPNFSPRRQDMCEPLMQLADAVGGEWPARIRQALTTLFEEEVAFNLQSSLQLLADLRDCFAHHSYPERLSTVALLDWMRALPARPWDVDGPMSAHTLARLLMAFEIRPRVQRIGSAHPARGYQLEDFKEPWRRHLRFEASQSEIVNKDKGCNAVAEVSALSIPARENLDARRGMNGQPVTSNCPIPNLPNYPILQEAHGSEIANKDGLCNAVSHAGVTAIPA